MSSSFALRPPTISSFKASPEVKTILRLILSVMNARKSESLFSLSFASGILSTKRELRFSKILSPATTFWFDGRSNEEAGLNQPSRDFAANIDGVFAARQDRSRKTRDAFIESGFSMLNRIRFNDLKVSDLAQHSGRSVGSFYKRFEDKEAFFRALQAATVARDQKIIKRRLDRERLDALSPGEVLNELIDTLADIFSSEVRGVLRESLLRILEPEDGWAPMRESGKDVQQRIVDRLRSSYPEMSEAQTERKLRFCYQIIVGVLQNDLVNDYHVVSTADRSVRLALKAVVADHMASDSRY